MGDLETIIVLVLLAFIFIPQRLHHSLILPRSLLCYCNSNAWGWNNSHQSGVISITNQLIFQNRKSSKVYWTNNNRPKILPCDTPDTMLTSLLLQPSTITCCDRFDRNFRKANWVVGSTPLRSINRLRRIYSPSGRTGCTNISSQFELAWHFEGRSFLTH